MMTHDISATETARGSTWNLDRTAETNEWSGVAVAFAQHRDSDALERSNFRVIRADLDSRFGQNVAPVVQLGHWAVGWVEYLIHDAGRADITAAVAEWRARLADYPLADEDDYGQLEWDDNHPDDGLCYAEAELECGCGMVPV